MKKAALFGIGFVFVVSCNTVVKEDKPTVNESKETKKEIEKTSTASTSSGDNTIEFYLNGDENHIVKKADISLDEIKGKQMLNVSTSSMGDTKNLLVIDVKDIAPGTYSFDEKGKYGAPTASFMPDVMDVDNTYKFTMGSVTISSNDGNVINGTFEGAAANSKGDLFSISKGKIINAKIHKRLTTN
jgi:hypothetical protein